jgi:hypothetical protein
MESRRDNQPPESMTASERHDELVATLANGLVRSIRHTRSGTATVSDKVSELSSTGLELSANLPLSVAPQPSQ